MNVTEYAYVNDKLYRLNDELLAGGVTIRAMLDVGWTLELMVETGHLVAKREAENLLRIKAAALEVCNAAQTASSLNELYAAIARLHDTL